MGKPKHKTFKDESDNGKVRAQSKRIKELEKEVERLKAELRTLNKAFEKSAKFMSESSKSLTVDELIKAANDDQTLKEAKEQYLTAKIEKERSQQETRDKFKKWAEENRRGLKPEGSDD